MDPNVSLSKNGLLLFVHGAAFASTLSRDVKNLVKNSRVKDFTCVGCLREEPRFNQEGLGGSATIVSLDSQYAN